MKSRFGRVGVLMGGPSGEREISLRSGAAVAEALRSRGHEVVAVDPVESPRQVIAQARLSAAFIALHGPFGEDGQVQGILEELSIPYTGSGVDPSRLAIDKAEARKRFEEAGVAVPPAVVLEEGNGREVNGLAVPWVVKPSRQGSSLGLTVVRDRRDLEPALREAYRYDSKVLVESRVEGRELTVGILNERPLTPIEIVPPDGVFDFEAKYTKGRTRYVIPPDLPANLLKRAQDAALACHRALGCRHLSRVDLILTRQGIPVALEVNTIPGFTETSLLPKAARAAGLDFPDLCERLLEMALNGKI